MKRKILVDTSVWIEYFAGNPQADNIDILIDDNRVCTNKIILCELIPFLKEKNQDKLIDLLYSIEEIPLEIRWEKIIEYQTKNLACNLRKIGIPDLIILDNVIKNDLGLFIFDKHFCLMQKLFNIKIYDEKKHEARG